MFGNHENYRLDQYDVIGHNSDWLKNGVADMWEPWLSKKAIRSLRATS